MAADSHENNQRGWPVNGSAAGLRLDVFVARGLNLSRAQARRLIEAGAVRVDDRRAKPGDKGLLLEAGMRVSVDDAALTAADRIVPEPQVPLVVLAEGDGYLVVDKPAGVNVHPLRPGERGTLLNRVIARYPQAQDVGEGGLRSGVVHRLDADTSGVVIFATTQARWEVLRRAFAEHRTRKIYRTIVRGRMIGSRREVMRLVVGRGRPAKVKVVADVNAPIRDSGVRRCDLQWEAMRTFHRATLLQISLGTGFLHQIRVMMAHLGHPVLGDALYGDPASDPLAVPRQMLHAAQLHVEDIDVISPDPPDFAQALASAR